MVRQVSKPLSGSEQITPTSNPEVTQVVARPVNRSTLPEHNSLNALVSALGQVQPGLHRYLAVEQQKQDEENELKGTRDRVAQTDNAYTVPPEADPAYQRGYKKAHGKILADEAKRQLEADFEEHKNNPDFNPETFVSKAVTENIAGVDDPDILSTYLPTFAQAVDQYRDKFRAFQTEKVRENAEGYLLSQSRGIVEEVAKGTPMTREKLLAFQQEGLTLNKSRNETNELLLQNFQVYGDQGHPAIYEVFFQPDENGIAPVDNKEFGTKVNALVDRAQRVYEQTLKEKTAHSDLGVWTSYKARLEREDPNLTVEEIFNDPSLNETDKRTFIGENLQLQHKLQIREVARAEILTGDARFGTLPPEDQKVYQGEFDRLGQDMLTQAGADAGARRTALGQIITLGTKNGLLYGPMKQLLSTVDATVPADGKTGEVPQTVIDAHTFYSEMKRINPAVAFQYTSEGSKTFLDVYDHALNTGSTPQQAYAAAVRMADPETKRQNSEFLGRNSKDILGAVEGQLSKVEGSDVFFGFGKDKTRNIEAIKSYVLHDIRNNPAAAYLGVEQATQNAIDKFKATHVNDGNGHYLFVGLGGATADLGAAVKMHVDGIKKAHKDRTGQEAGDFFLQPAPGNGDTYQVWDALGPLAVPQVSRQQLLESYRTATSKLDLQTAQSKPQVLEFANTIRNSLRGAVNPELMQQLDTMDPQVRQLYKKGGMSFMDFTQYQTAKAALKARNWDDRMKGRKTISESPLAQGMGVDIPKVEMTAPKLSPKDGAKAVDIAIRYQDSDPHFSLTAAIEGLSLTVYPDPAGGRAIGVGYNIDKRGEAAARKDLKAAMVPETVIEKLLSKDPKVASSVSINPEQAARLYKKVQPEYEAIAKKPIGDAWENLTGNQKAALTYLAYNTGQAYPKALAAIQKGDLQSAAKEMTIRYADAKTGEYKQNLRAMDMVRSMFLNPNRYKAQLDYMRGGWFHKNPDNYALR